MDTKMTKASLFLMMLVLCIACKTKTNTTTPSEENTVLVQLTETATPETLEEQFEMADLQQKKRISNTMRIYLFTFNSQKIKLENLLEQLKVSELVVEAQANQLVTNRN